MINAILCFLFGISCIAQANLGATMAFPPVGGTGSSTLSGILIGNGTSPVRTLTIGTNLTLTGTTLDASGGSGTFPFTPTSYGNSTSSVIAFTAGLISQSSTTIPVLGSGLVGANNGLLYGISSSSAVSLSITGLAGTATALAANGANCTAGQYPLGVNASGAVEDCTAAAAGGADFTYATDIGFGVTGSATTTKTQFTLGIHASGTSQFSNATSTLFTAATAWLTNLFIGVDTLAEYIADTAGAMFTGNTETDITVTYDDADK